MTRLFVAVLVWFIVPFGIVHADQRHFTSKDLEREQEIGKEAAKEFNRQHKIEKGTPRAERVERIGKKIGWAAGSSGNLSFSIVTDMGGKNAFAFPGGPIYITVELLDVLATDDELAAVLGHEIRHVTGHHYLSQLVDQEYLTETLNRQINQSPYLKESIKDDKLAQGFIKGVFTVLGLKYSRKDEEEADREGLGYMAAAGYNPRAFPVMLKERMGGEKKSKLVTWLSSHPDVPRRAEKLEAIIAAAYSTTAPYDSTKGGVEPASTSFTTPVLLAFAFLQKPNAQIMGMNPDGTGQRSIVTLDRSSLGKIAVSPDGTKLAFSVMEADEKGHSRQKIFLLDGQGIKDITPRDILAALYPSFSPDGKTIVFSAQSKESFELFRLGLERGAIHQLTESALPKGQPTYNPQGTHIAYVVWEKEIPVIHLMCADGSGDSVLTNNASANYAPAFSPDGAKIVFVSKRDGNTEIYLMDADGGNQKRLTAEPSMDTSPCFAADGSKIIFESMRSGKHHIYSMNLDGSNVTQLTTGGGPYFCPSSPVAFKKRAQ